MSPSFGSPSPRCCGSYDMPCEHWVSPSEQRQLDLAARPEPEVRYCPPRTYTRRPYPRSTPQDDFTPVTPEDNA